MSTTTNHWITGMFKDYAHASRAIEALQQRGYREPNISVVMTEATRTRELGQEGATKDKVLQGAGIGSAVGTTVGAVVAAIAAIGTMIAIPPLGIFVAGPIAAGLAGAGAGGVVGGVVGALIGTGIPKNRAELYEAGMKKGAVVVGVHNVAENEAAKVEKIFEDLHAEKIRN